MTNPLANGYAIAILRGLYVLCGKKLQQSARVEAVSYPSESLTTPKPRREAPGRE